MKRYLLIIIALLCMMVQGALADSSFGGGDGSAKNPYIINTAAHWDQLFTDCLSSVVINSSVSGDGTHGGFVANCQNNDDVNNTEVTFTSCAFDGKLLGTDTNSWGGFVGWTEGYDGAIAVSSHLPR